MLYKNGVIEETGLAAGVLNHPATGVAWLANKIAPYDEQLNAGDVVLAGSFTRPTAAKARRRLPRRLRAARRGRVPLRLRGMSCKHPSTHSSRRSQQAACRSACGSALADAYAIEVMAGAGFDWLLIDGEHAPNDLRTVLASCRPSAAYPAHADRAAGDRRRGR